MRGRWKRTAHALDQWGLAERRGDERHRLDGEPGRHVHAAELGTFNRVGGTVNLTGTLDNRGTELALNAATGSWQLAGGTIWGGTGHGLGRGEVAGDVPRSNRLDGVVMNADVSVDAARFAVLHVVNGLTLNGTIRLGGDRADVYFDNTQSLLGAGSIVFTTAGYGDHELYIAGGSTLTIGPQMTVRGGRGVILRTGQARPV